MTTTRLERSLDISVFSAPCEDCGHTARYHVESQKVLPDGTTGIIARSECCEKLVTFPVTP